MKAFLKRLLYWEGFDLFSGWKNVSDFQNLPSRAEENLLRDVKDVLKKTYLDYFDIENCNFLPLYTEYQGQYSHKIKFICAVTCQYFFSNFLVESQVNYRGVYFLH